MAVAFHFPLSIFMVEAEVDRRLYDIGVQISSPSPAPCAPTAMPTALLRTWWVGGHGGPEMIKRGADTEGAGRGEAGFPEDSQLPLLLTSEGLSDALPG